MLEMATDKETFLVPAPPPPLKPPPRGGGDGHLVVRLPRGDAPPEEEKGAVPVPAGQLQQGAGGGEGGAAPAEEAEDSVAELQQRLPRNGFQPPHPKPPGGGKRRNSCNVGGGFKHPAFKRRRRVNSECDPVLPSEFLLGGNIFDPLNLNSLLDEEVNQALNAETPKSSPLPAKGRDPVEILIPKDITDPLSLNAAQDDPPVLASPAKAARKRHRHRGGAQRAASAAEAGKAPSSAAAPSCRSCQKACNGATPQPYELNTAINCRDEVVPPPLLLPPPPGGSGDGQASGGGGGSTPSCAFAASSAGGRHHHRKRRRTSSKSEGPSAARQQQQQGSSSEAQCRSSPRCRPPPPPPPAAQQPRRQPQQRRFQYGNYCKYYGYRNPDCEDSRLRAMRPEWFEGKEVLDVGCNVGHLTLSLAKKWAPRRMVGLDIDGALVRSARQNIRHYLSEEIRQRAGGRAAAEGGGGAAGQPKKTFPAALMASRGPIAAPRVPQEGAQAAVFPDNVIFLTVRAPRPLASWRGGDRSACSRW